MLKGKMWFTILVILLLASVIAAGCAGNGEDPSAQSKDQENGETYLSAGGASFPYPLYTEWITAYQNETEVKIEYEAIGSGGGVSGILDGTFDFAGSDAPMTEEEMEKASSEILHIPTVMGAVVVTYNLPEVDTSIKLTPGVLSDIFLGEITNWNDSEIADLNGDIDLPDKDIAVIHRSDGSGTTNAFTDYLSKVSDEWEETVGSGKSVSWPVGQGADGNDGVAAQVKQIEGAIGYVELAYTIENDLPYAVLENREGSWVEPSLKTTSEAAAGALEDMPEDMRVSITNAPGEDAWPISTFTYLLIEKEQNDKETAQAIIDFVQWTMESGDSYAEDLLYAPLPGSLKQQINDKLQTITVDGEPVLE